MSFYVNVLVSLAVACLYLFYTIFIQKSTPQLSVIFSLMIASVTVVSCMVFLIDLIQTKKSLGDYEEHKYVFFLGSFATIWVAIQTIVEKFTLG